MKVKFFKDSIEIPIILMKNAWLVLFLQFGILINSFYLELAIVICFQFVLSTVCLFSFRFIFGNKAHENHDILIYKSVLYFETS